MLTQLKRLVMHSPLCSLGEQKKIKYTQFLETVGVTIILKVCCVNIESLLRTLNPAEERLFALWYYPLQASWTIESSSLPMDWPLKGTLEFQEYGLQYRKGLELALKGITLNIHEKEKVSHNPKSLQYVKMKLNINSDQYQSCSKLLKALYEKKK